MSQYNVRKWSRVVASHEERGRLTPADNGMTPKRQLVLDALQGGDCTMEDFRALGVGGAVLSAMVACGHITKIGKLFTIKPKGLAVAPETTTTEVA